MSSVSSPCVSSIGSVLSTYPSEEENGMIRRRRPRIFRERNNPFDIYSEQEFKMRFRISKNTAINILDLIKENIFSFTHRNHSITAMNQLLITLRFYACGSFQIIVGDHFNITKSTAGRIIHRVSHYIAMLREQFISMPTTNHELNHLAREFFNISGFPNVCGAIDCTHIKIQSPGGNNAENFRNRKGWFSLNVQAICDAHLAIRDIVVRWPGSTHDSRIFNNSLIRAKFENNEFGNKYLLGDSGYPCRRYLLTPLLNTGTPAERRYNDAHIKTRNCIERTFGVLKRRFPCLSLGLRVNLLKAIPIIVATCVLHNIALNLEDAMYNNENFEENEPPEVLNNMQQNNAVRNAVIATVFQR